MCVIIGIYCVCRRALQQTLGLRIQAVDQTEIQVDYLCHLTVSA